MSVEQLQIIAHSPMSSDELGVVVIGRNEGKRLIDCLASVRTQAQNIVYVDSGSSDGSVIVAERLGAVVVSLDSSQPFTAARGRNAGFAALKAKNSGVRYVQFIDGDCELVAGWLDTALQFLESRIDVAVVCGRRRERYPERSVYNRICDIEWDTAVGQAAACGGDALMRAIAFEEVYGFRPILIAGEEPEMCMRLRRRGWKIWRLDVEMTLHDAAMTRFSQFWFRAVRSGYAEAEISSLHAGTTTIEKRQLARSFIWAGILPMVISLGALFHPAALAGALIYLFQIGRIAVRRGGMSPESWVYGALMMISKFAQLQGNFKYWCRYFRGKQIRAIEYK